MNIDKKSVKKTLEILVPALLIVFVTLYLLGAKNKIESDDSPLSGMPLVSYSELYPVLADENAKLYLDKDLYMKAVSFFIENPSPKAISDLIYLGQTNLIFNKMSGSEKVLYQKLLDKNPTGTESINREKDELFKTYIDIVNGIGKTLAGTDFEIVIHDTRNPIQSIIAIQNSVTGRQIGSPNSNFGLQLIKNYAFLDKESGSFIGYPLVLANGTKIKSTTIPLFNKKYGLIGFICVNISISKFDDPDYNKPDVRKFVDSWKQITPNQKIDEFIETAKPQGKK